MWQDLSQQLLQTANEFVRFIKIRRREETAIGIAGLLLWLSFSINGWLSPELSNFAKFWHGDLIVSGILFTGGLVFFSYGIYRIWKLVYVPELTPTADRPFAIKGPLAFTPADGQLFRKLGREDDLRKLLGYIQDDQTSLIVLMGASGVGKTSLLRAGLTDILRTTNIQYHYWEATSSESERGLFTAIRQSFLSKSNDIGPNTLSHMRADLSSLDDLINSSPELGKHVIVLDQFEQLGKDTKGPIFELLRKVTRKSKPPYHITWIVAFRREYSANWFDFIISEEEQGFIPSPHSVHLFTPEQARQVISQLICEASLSVEQRVVDNLIEAATVEGKVSSVDIGIGALILSGLHSSKTLTQDVYLFAGGAEGLLTQYIDNCLVEHFPEDERKSVLNAMLALRDAETNHRIASGKTAEEIISEIEAERPRHLKIYLERLTQRDIRLLEHAQKSGEREVKYRLPHERLIPALSRLSGKLIGELEEAKVKFSTAYAAWRNTKESQYFLRGKILRLVLKYKNQIPWGNETKEKHYFLDRSRRRRNLYRVSSIILIAFLSLFFVYGYYESQKAADPFLSNKYTSDIYTFQRRLKLLELKEPWFNLNNTIFLDSESLETIVLKSSSTTDSIDGLVRGLKKCPNIKNLTLEFPYRFKIKDLSEIPDTITKLTLNISDSELNTLPPLPPNLKELNLLVGKTKLKEIPKLPDNLVKLNLYIKNNEIEILPELPNTLENLSLTVSDTQIKSLPRLPDRLNNLELDLQYTQLTELPELPDSISKLSMNLAKSQITVIPSLPVNLKELDLVLVKSKVSTLPELNHSALASISLNLRDSLIKEIPELPHGLNEFSYSILGSQLTDWPKLPSNLQTLTLDFRGTSLHKMPSLPTEISELSIDFESGDLQDLQSLTSEIGILHKLIKLNIDFSDTRVENLPLIPETINDLSLNVSNSRIRTLPKLPSHLSKFALNIGDSEIVKVDDFPPSLTELNMILGKNRMETIPILPDNLSKLTLDLDNSEIKSLPLFPETLDNVTLNLKYSLINDLSPLEQQNNIKTLNLTTNSVQRASLHHLPANITVLRF